MMNERRQSPRIEPPKEVIGTVKATVPAKILDLSLRGIQVEVASTLRPGAGCNVTVPALGGGLRLRARVQRCRALSLDTAETGVGGIVYRAGLAFKSLSAKELKALEDAIVDFSLSKDAAGGKEDGESGPIRIQIDPQDVNHR